METHPHIALDAPLALAELAKMKILIQHALRRCRVDNNYELSKEFYAQLGALKEEAGRTMVEIRRVNEKGC